MRSRAGSWSLAFVLILSVLVIATSSGPGFLALAQSDGTPAVEEPVPEEQSAVEVATETPVPEVPTEDPIPPSETAIFPTEPAGFPTETLVPNTVVADDAIVQAASDVDIPLNINACTIYPAYWLVHLALDQQAFPSSLTFGFSSGALVSVAFSGISWVEGSGYRGTYVSYANLGIGDQLVTVSGDVPNELNPIAYLTSGPTCVAPGPTATTIPTVTLTPTWSGATTMISATFVDCAPNAALWQFRLTTQGALPGGASWPAAVDLTFASGATGTAIKISETIGESAAQLEYRSQNNLTDALVAGAISLPTGVTGVLELMYAPDCSPGIPSTATSAPTEAPTDTATSTATSTPNTATYTAGFDYCTLSPSRWFWILDFRGTVEQVPASIYVTFASGASETVQATYRELSGTLVSGWYPTSNHLSDHVVSATAEAPSGVSVWFELTQGPSCQPGMPGDPTSTATPTNSATATVTDTPSVTATPTVPSSTELMMADFSSCQPEGWWYFQMFIEAEPSWLPSSITLTFANGETATVAQQGSDSVAGVGSWAYFNWYQHLSATLVSATAEVYAGTVGTLDLVWAPNCQQGVPDGSTETPIPTATPTSTPTETLTPSLTPTATATEDLERVWVSFVGCITNNGDSWNLTYRYIGALTTAVPTLTFSDGSTATASIAFHTNWGNGEYETEAVWTGNLDAQLVSATLPRAGMQNIDFRVRAAPNCEQGTLNDPSATVTASHTPTETETATEAPTEAVTDTPTYVPTITSTPTAPATPTETASGTPSATPSETATAANTPTDVPSETATATNTPTASPTIIATPTPTATDTATTISTATTTATPVPPVTIPATFAGCQFDASGWTFQLDISGTFPVDAAYPLGVDLTFESGATALALMGSSVSGPGFTQILYSYAEQLGDKLVSATVEVPYGVAATLLVYYAPFCAQGTAGASTWTPSAIATSTFTATATLTSSPSETATNTSTNSPTSAASDTATTTPTATATETATATGTASATPTGTATPTASGTATSSSTPTASATATATVTPTWTSSSTATATATDTAPATVTPSNTPTATATETVTQTATPTPSSTATASWTATTTPSETPTITRTPSSIPSDTATATATTSDTATATSSAPATSTETPSTTSTPTATATPTASNTATATRTASSTPTATRTRTVTPTATSTPGPVVVATTNVNCRSAASTSASSFGVVPRGTLLRMRGATTNGWTPVFCFGQNGWISTRYVPTTTPTRTPNRTATATPTRTPTRTVTATPTLPSQGTVVTRTRVNCRTAPSTSASIILVVNGGAAVTLRGATQSGWTPVACGGQNGWISSQYLRVR